MPISVRIQNLLAGSCPCKHVKTKIFIFNLTNGMTLDEKQWYVRGTEVIQQCIFLSFFISHSIDPPQMFRNRL
jgi:hypothetical protein